MNNTVYKPLFGDYEVQQEHFAIFGVSTYTELFDVLSKATVEDEKEYFKLFDMYKTMVFSEVLWWKDALVKRNFFKTPNTTLVQEIYQKKLYEDDAYLSERTKEDYTEIDELTIDHLSFLLLDDDSDKYMKTKEIITKLLEQINLLQNHFPDKLSQQKIKISYILHFLVVMEKSLSSLSLGRLERKNEDEYLVLNEETKKYEETVNEVSKVISEDKSFYEGLTKQERENLIQQITHYQYLMVQKYHELIASAVAGGAVMINELWELIMNMINNHKLLSRLKM